ncbi:RNA degradosome polyphosphate kinase, partial [bacterium]|nr:RNA degradosome polyphosphate kinase [bacterium]
RFLEHSRIYVFTNGGDPLVFLGSADLMPRNLHRRVEVVFPILDPELRRQFLKTIVPAYSSDNRKARVLGQNGLSTRSRLPENTPAHRVQDEFLLRYNPSPFDIPQITPALRPISNPARSVNA